MKIWIMILFIGSISCGEKPKGIQYVDKGFSNLEIVDTVFLDFPFFKFASYKNGKLLGYNPYTNDVVVVDVDAKNLAMFNKFGVGPEDYFLLYNNVGFTENEEVVIGGIEDLKVYDQSGKFLRNYSVIRESSHAPLLKPFGKNNSIFAINLPQGSSSNLNFFDSNHEFLLEYNLVTETNTIISGLPLKKLNNYSGYYLNNGLIVSSHDDNKLFLMDQNEPVLRVFNLETRKEESSLFLDLQYFNPYLIPFGKKIPQEELKLLSAMNSTIYNIFVQDNLIYVIYDLPYSEDEIKGFYEKSRLQAEQNMPPVKYIVHICNKYGKRIVEDIPISPDYGKPVFFKENYMLTVKEGYENNLLLKINLSL
jgi:hypothetical protein